MSDWFLYHVRLRSPRDVNIKSSVCRYPDSFCLSFSPFKKKKRKSRSLIPRRWRSCCSRWPGFTSPLTQLPHLLLWSSSVGWRASCALPGVTQVNGPVLHTCPRCSVTLLPFSHKSWSNGPLGQLRVASLPLSTLMQTLDKLTGKHPLQIPSWTYLIAIFRYVVLWTKSQAMKLQQLDCRSCGTSTCLGEGSLSTKTVRAGWLEPRSGSCWSFLMVQWSLNWFERIGGWFVYSAPVKLQTVKNC